MTVDVEGVDKVRELERQMNAYNLRGQWQAHTDSTRPQRIVKGTSDRVSMEPSTSGVLHCWRWERIAEFMKMALDGLSESQASRRSLILTNPGLQRGTTHTLIAAYQIVAPGEVAWAHRHTVNALRFGIEGGPNVFTVVDGVAVPMEPYDLVLTPGWQWHEHHNETDRPAYWLDCLDVPFTLALNQSFYEEFDDKVQPRLPTEDASASLMLRPSWVPRGTISRPFRYPWSETIARLKALSTQNPSPHEGIALEYLNPITGGPTLESIGCHIHYLPPGFSGRAFRRSSSAIFFVVEGDGRSVVEDQEQTWGKHDTFVVPNWSWLRMINRSKREPAILFSMSDAPILEKFGFYREQIGKT